MPCYDQRCRDCGITFEAIVLSFSAPRPCPECESSDTEQLISMPHFRVRARSFEMKRGRCHDPYQDLTLQHVRDEHGKPIKVNSEAELHAAEKRYGFVHNASWGTEKDPPQHEPWAGKIDHKYRRKWNRDPNAYGSESARKGVSAGVVSSAEETLAHRPNPV